VSVVRGSAQVAQRCRGRLMACETQKRCRVDDADSASRVSIEVFCAARNVTFCRCGSPAKGEISNASHMLRAFSEPHESDVINGQHTMLF